MTAARAAEGPQPACSRRTDRHRPFRPVARCLQSWRVSAPAAVASVLEVGHRASRWLADKSTSVPCQVMQQLQCALHILACRRCIHARVRLVFWRDVRIHLHAGFRGGCVCAGFWRIFRPSIWRSICSGIRCVCKLASPAVMMLPQCLYGFCHPAWP